MRRMLLSCGLFASLGLLTATANAQTNNLGSRTGSTGSTSGSSMFGSSGFGTVGSSAGFGTSNGGFGAPSAGGLGTGGMGTGGMGAGGMGTGGMGAGGMGGQQGGGFLGRNTNQQQFLGGNNQGQNQGMNQGRTGANGMANLLGNTNRGGNRGGMNLMNSQMGNFGGSNTNQAPVIRPRQRVAFDYPAPKSEALQSNLQGQITKVSIKNPKLSNVMVTTNAGGEVVIRGAVKSEADAKLAENLVRLEPGVRSVRNELTFIPTEPKAD